MNGFGSNMSNKKTVLVTLADKKFLNQARQLFSSAYWNGGWDGDYLLLAHGDIPEKDLEWFKEKGITIFRCKPIQEGWAGLWHPAIVLDKFYIFTPYFKQWERIIFLDADTTVRASIKKLAELDEPFAAPNAHGTSLRAEFIKTTKENRPLFKELKKEYPLKGEAFNSGIMAIKTSVIDDGTFEKLINLYEKFGSLNKYGEEATINLLFYKNWKMLPSLYNVYPYRTFRRFGVPYAKVEAIILHPVREGTAKPWLPSSPFYEEWLTNLKKSDAMDIKSPQTPARIWTIEEEKNHTKILKKRMIVHYYRYIFFFFDWLIGQIGLLIKFLSPKLYEKIRPKK